jgi:AcrR family transcriptional regulator
MTYSHKWVSVMSRSSASSHPSNRAPSNARRSRRSAELRDRLFRAALALFARKGYAETTVEDITEAADLGKGTFFNYFPSKEHVLLGFAEMQLAKLEIIIGEIRQSAQPMSESLRGLVHRMTEAPIQNPAVVRALLQAHLSSQVVREGMFRLHREHQKLIGGLLRHGQEQGEVRRDLPAEEIAQVLRQMIFGTLLFWTLSGDASLTERIEQSLNLLWAGIAPRSSPLASNTGEFPAGKKE